MPSLQNKKVSASNMNNNDSESAFYYDVWSVDDVCKLPIFFEQRDIDNKRVPSIVEAMSRSTCSSSTHLHVDAPIILLECRNYGAFLLDRNQQRVSKAVVDGQHRIAAIQQLQKQHRKFGRLLVPVFVHMVDSLAQGRRIQYQLFEQKPVDTYDRIQQRTYRPQQVVDQWVAEMQRKDPQSTKRFKHGRYSDKQIRPRKYHFMVDEFVHAIKNSPHVAKWIQGEVQHTELASAIQRVVFKQCQAFNALSEVQRRNYVNIQQGKHYQLFLQYLTKTPFQMISYVYYKQYNRLVADLELELEIMEYDDESDDDVSEHELDSFMECANT